MNKLQFIYLPFLLMNIFFCFYFLTTGILLLYTAAMNILVHVSSYTCAILSLGYNDKCEIAYNGYTNVQT